MNLGFRCELLIRSRVSGLSPVTTRQQQPRAQVGGPAHKSHEVARSSVALSFAHAAHAPHSSTVVSAKSRTTLHFLPMQMQMVTQPLHSHLSIIALLCCSGSGGHASPCLQCWPGPDCYPGSCTAMSLCTASHLASQAAELHCAVPGPGVARFAMAPLLSWELQEQAGAHADWIFLGPPHTLFFEDAARQMVADLDPAWPHFLTGGVFWAESSVAGSCEACMRPLGLCSAEERAAAVRGSVLWHGVSGHGAGVCKACMQAILLMCGGRLQIIQSGRGSLAAGGLGRAILPRLSLQACKDEPAHLVTALVLLHAACSCPATAACAAASAACFASTTRCPTVQPHTHLPGPAACHPCTSAPPAHSRPPKPHSPEPKPSCRPSVVVRGQLPGWQAPSLRGPQMRALRAGPLCAPPGEHAPGLPLHPPGPVQARAPRAQQLHRDLRHPQVRVEGVPCGSSAPE